MEDADLTELQITLSAFPDAGVVIPGSGGCRKLRWQTQGRGKRGGYRIIYFLRTPPGAIVLVTLYSKHVQDNIAAGVLKALKARFDDGQDDR